MRLLPISYPFLIGSFLWRNLGATADDIECSIWNFVPLTIRGVDNPLYSDELNNSLGYSHMAAAQLAMNHFNARDSSVVPQLGDDVFRYENCRATFNTTATVVFDTQTFGSHAIKSVFDAVSSGGFPCAIAGPQNDRPATDLSSMASSAEIPQVTHGGMDFRLAADYYTPYTSVVTGFSISVSSSVISFLLHIGRLQFVSVLYALSDTGLHIKEGLLLDGVVGEARIETFSYPIESVTDDLDFSIGTSLAVLKKNGFRTVVHIVSSVETELPAVADAAEELGMNNGEYVWIFVGTNTLFYFENEPSIVENANIRKLLRGAVVFGDLDGFMHDPEHDKFLASWRLQNASFVAQVNSLNPIEEGNPGHFVAENDYFQRIDPLAGAGFMYDAVMSIGMGLCLGNITELGTKTSGMSHKKGVRSAEFDGATGRMAFGGNDLDLPGSRALHTLTIGAFNLFPNLDSNGTDSSRFTLSMILQRSSSEDFFGKWKEITPLVYATGTSDPPILLRDIPEQNYLTEGVRIFGLTFMAMAQFVILISVVWVVVCRKSQVVRASQPVFLYLLAFGSFVQTLAILMMSFDESYGWDTTALGKACTAVVWLMIMGHVVNYSALFTKLWRINKVLQFRRAQVKYKHVAGPSIAIGILTIILLSVWTAMGGLYWNRQEIDYLTGESIGQCDTEKDILPIMIPILILVVIPTVLTAYMAWKTKDVESKYSESSWIFTLIVLHLQVLFVSIPVIYIMYSQSTDARYIVYVMLIWVFAMSNMCFIIGPKVYNHHFVKVESSKTRGNGSGGVHVSGIPGNDRNSRSQEILSSMIESRASNTNSTAEEAKSGDD